MRHIRFRLVLPIIFGFLALTLFAWDYQNERVVAAMGMGWDTGPPLWPYRAVPLFSYAVNVPAYVVSWPLVRKLDPRVPLHQYAVWLLAIVALWWLVGTRMDFGLLGRRRHSRPKLAAVILLVSGVVSLALGARVCIDEYFSFQKYWPNQPPVYAILLLRAAGPMLWCLLWAVVAFRSAFHLLWGQSRCVRSPQSTT